MIRIDAKVFHTIAAMAPQVSASVGAAALERMGGLQQLARETTRPELVVVGPRSLAALG